MPRELEVGLRVQVQAENVTHAEGLARMATRLEALGGEVEDTRTLLAALQGAGRLFPLFKASVLNLEAKQGTCVSR